MSRTQTVDGQAPYARLNCYCLC